MLQREGVEKKHQPNIILVLTGALIFFLLLIALLAIPVSIIFQVSWKKSLRSKIRLNWLFGLVRFSLSPGYSPSASQVEDKATKKKRHKPKSPVSKKSSRFPAVWQKNFYRRVIRFVRDVWRAVKKENLMLHARIGLGDPADTGQLWAVLGAVAGMLASIKQASISIEPEFQEMIFELDGSGEVRIIPLQLLYIVMGFMLSPTLWRAVRNR